MPVFGCAMPPRLEYHKPVKCLARRSVPASLAMFGMLVFLIYVLLIHPASAQITSSSSSGHSGAPPTGPVSPPTGPVAPPTGGFPHAGNSGGTHSNVPHSPGSPNSLGHHPSHHTANGTAYYPYVYALPVPYAVDVPETDNSDADQDADYQGGPTIFDRRGSGPDDYVPPSSSGPAHSPTGPAQGAEAADTETPQNPTILVFKDGHQIEVGNYAILSQTLYDLTPGHPLKIALADLDLSATEKQNEDHGVTFQLPPAAQAN